MKINIKALKTRLIIPTLASVILFACVEDLHYDQLYPTEVKLEPYILNLIDSEEPADKMHFVRLKFVNAELQHSAGDSIISLIPTSSSGYGNMRGKGYAFRNNQSGETIEISFYAPAKGPSFSFQTANYRYGNPWQSLSGVNVKFFTPAYEEHSYFRYLGTNQADSYFKITWIDNKQICGRFKTRLFECCGGPLTYWVEGEFSIPRIY